MTQLMHDIRDRRIWYNKIEVEPGLSTRFQEDYEANPHLKAVDEGNQSILDWLEKRYDSIMSGKRILDVGSADGLYSIWAARCGAEKAVGVERNRYNFDRAQWLGSNLELENLQFAWGGIEDHCPGEHFDYVFCLNLLYHLVEPLRTLTQLRRKCRRELILVTAIDLPNDDCEPLMRLDRYANDSHGVWSFNVAMVRQMLTTAGFHIGEEHLEKRTGGDRYFAACRPGDFESHHIFEDRIDQEFPIHMDRRREKVRNAWKAITAEIQGPVALFGAGTHTPWLLKQTEDIDGVQVSCILDDRIPLDASMCGLPVVSPESANPTTFQAVVLSSWHQTDVLHKRAVDLFKNQVPIVSLIS